MFEVHADTDAGCITRHYETLAEAKAAANRRHDRWVLNGWKRVSTDEGPWWKTVSYHNVGNPDSFGSIAIYDVAHRDSQQRY